MGVTPIYSIPFAEPTDLVRDWPELSEDVADAVEAAIAAVPVLAGIGSNVVQTVKTDTFSTTSSTFVDIDDLEATITPTSDTSKILVIGYVNVSNATDSGSAFVRLVRGSTVVFVGDAAGSRTPTSFGWRATGENRNDMGSGAPVFLDSPGVATAVTYKFQMRRGLSGTAVLNDVPGSGDSATTPLTPSSITLIEVAP